MTDVRMKPLCKPEAFASQLELEYGGTLVDEHPLSPEHIHSSTYRADELLKKYPYVAELLETDGFYPEELVVPDPGFNPFAVFRMSVELVAPLQGEGLPDTFTLDHARVGDSMEGIAMVNSPDYEHDAVRSI